MLLSLFLYAYIYTKFKYFRHLSLYLILFCFQEKELLEQHNVWLNEELNGKVKGLMEERRTSADLEADLQSKLLQVCVA